MRLVSGQLCLKKNPIVHSFTEAIALIAIEHVFGGHEKYVCGSFGLQTPLRCMAKEVFFLCCKQHKHTSISLQAAFNRFL